RENVRCRTASPSDWTISATKADARSSRKIPAPQAVTAPTACSVRAAFDAPALAAPAQHPARQVRDLAETRLLQDCRRMGRAAAGAADGDDRLVRGQLSGPSR